MKTTVKIYGRDYEVEINAKDLSKSVSDSKATKIFIEYLELRLHESLVAYASHSVTFKSEIRQNVYALDDLLD